MTFPELMYFLRKFFSFYRRQKFFFRNREVCKVPKNFCVVKHLTAKKAGKDACVSEGEWRNGGTVKRDFGVILKLEKKYSTQ
jgi:hypothetical protein